MSLTITVYAVSLNRLNKVLGSGNQTTIDSIVSANKDFLANIDEIDDEAELKCADAVAELIDGETSEDELGYVYGYALEAICSHVGEALPNIPSISGSSDWISDVDAMLESKKLPLSLSALIYDGSPVPLPAQDDYPFIGIWPAEAIPAAHAAFTAADPAGLEEEMAETLEQMRDWLKTAVKTPGTSLIGFLS